MERSESFKYHNQVVLAPAKESSAAQSSASMSGPSSKDPLSRAPRGPGASEDSSESQSKDKLVAGKRRSLEGRVIRGTKGRFFFGGL